MNTESAKGRSNTFAVSLLLNPTRVHFQFRQAYLPEWAWALEERNELGRLIDPRLEGEQEKHAESMERMTRVSQPVYSFWKGRSLSGPLLPVSPPVAMSFWREEADVGR
jgi:hypothetical protein